MTFPILGGNSAVGGYSIDNSLRFNDDDSAYLSRTPASAGNRKTWTWSGWVKRGNLGSGLYTPFSFGDNSTGGTDVGAFFRLQNDILYFIEAHGGVNSFYLETSQVFRDTSAWYHFVFAIDTTQATASDRIKIYVNGVQITSFASSTYPSLNFDTSANQSGEPQRIGVIDVDGTPSGQYFDGYMAEMHLIDGQALTPTDFGEFDEDSGIWKPIEYTGTYGTNGFYLDFEDSGSLGADQSGNSNDFTPTNLASTDQVLDSPTNNFSTMNPLIPNPIGTNHTFSEGNLKITGATSITGYAYSTYSLTQGKWYFEFRHLAGTPRVVFGDIDGGSQQGMYFQGTGPGGYVSKMVDNSGTTGVVTWSNNDIIGLAFDFDAKTFKVFHNGSEVFDETYTIDVEYFAILSDNSSVRDAEGTFNFGQDSSFVGTETRQNNSDGNGYGDFYYAPPSGYLALCTQNLATELSPTIDDGSQYFNTVLYTGNGSTQSITGVGFQPDWTWIKRRSTTGSHALMDSSRGEDEFLESDGTAAEVTFASSNFTFTSDGYDLDYTGGYNNINQSGTTYAGWNWLANGGTTSSNTDGSITSTVQANTTAGFNIITYTGDGNAGATFGHGLGAVPDLIIVKRRDSGSRWNVWTPSLTNNQALYLDGTEATQSSTTFWNDTTPTSSVITLGTDRNVNSGTYVCYAFKNIEGYSKFGSYTGNGSTDGTFVYTGFRPSFIIIKRTDAVKNWYIFDTVRNTYNVVDNVIAPNLSDAESVGTGTYLDILSNGFKLRQDFSHLNASGSTQIYYAVAENPFVSSTSIPVCAR